MSQAVKSAAGWLVKAGLPALMAAGLATSYMVENESSAPTTELVSPMPSDTVVSEGSKLQSQGSEDLFAMDREATAAVPEASGNAPETSDTAEPAPTAPIERETAVASPPSKAIAPQEGGSGVVGTLSRAPQAGLSNSKASSIPEPALSGNTKKFLDRFPADDAGVRVVKVRYATDRSSVSTWTQLPWITEAAPLILALISLAIVPFLVPARVRRFWPIAAVVGAAAGLVLSYGLWIRVDQFTRLASNYSTIYGGGRNEVEPEAYPLQLGIAEVSIPPNHKIGKIEAPSWTRLELREDEKKHIVLQKVTKQEIDSFYSELTDALLAAPRNELFVFIHGYNVQFGDAIKRTAQLFVDLEFPGEPICYSWPSTGELAGYTNDEASVGWTVTHLEKFLVDLQQETKASKIHLLAHSMGNRALCGALERIMLRSPERLPWLGQVVMAAPDVDAGELRNRYLPIMVKGAERVTLYTSRYDRALIASTAVHGKSRAGLADAKLFVMPGVETIDVSPIDPSLLGHSYYGSQPELINDMRAIVELGTPAPQRTWLLPVNVPQKGSYFILQSNDLAIRREQEKMRR